MESPLWILYDCISVDYINIVVFPIFTCIYSYVVSHDCIVNHSNKHIYSILKLQSLPYTIIFLQDNVFMHLTNYAINKHSEDFIRDDEAGSKR